MNRPARRYVDGRRGHLETGIEQNLGRGGRVLVVQVG
jgi:hypothetical protein